jgi:hypothetical protein
VEGQAILKNGMKFIEGRATVSTNLAQAYGYATDPIKRGYSTSEVSVGADPGLITAIAVPSEFHLGYATFTTAYIDRSVRLVLGAPLRYAGARKQLAFYLSVDTEASRLKIENEILCGKPLVSHPSFILDAHNIIGSFKPSSGLQNVITALEVSSKAFETVDFDSLERSLQSLFDVREPAQEVLVPTMVRDLILGTVESVILSRLRTMRWQGLALLGYTFREGHDDVAVTRVQDVAEQHRRIDEYGRMLASSTLFNGELAWLKVYAGHQLGLMRVELDGAELEAA